MDNEALVRLRRARHDAGLTQRQAAKLMNMPFVAFSATEYGSLELVFTDAEIRTMCKLYAVSEAWVRTGVNPNFTEEHKQSFVDMAQEKGFAPSDVHSILDRLEMSSGAEDGG